MFYFLIAASPLLAAGWLARWERSLRARCWYAACDGEVISWHYFRWTAVTTVRLAIRVTSRRGTLRPHTIAIYQRKAVR